MTRNWRMPRVLVAAVLESPQKPGFSNREREQHEDWLYFHLSVARRAAYSGSRHEPGSCEYFAARAERERALHSAREHCAVLVAARCQLPDMLREMARAEEIIR